MDRFFALLGLNALMAFVNFAFDLQQDFFAGQEMPSQVTGLPGWVLGLANGAAVWSRRWAYIFRRTLCGT